MTIRPPSPPSSSEQARPLAWPSPLPPVTLEGSLVRLEPMRASPDAEVLSDLMLAAGHDAVDRYLTSDLRTPDAFARYVNDLTEEWASGTALPFVVRLKQAGHPLTGRLVGVTRLKDVIRVHRRMAIGSWYTPEVWGTGANTEAKGLLMAHAFEQMGAIRVELETDRRNDRSYAALTALGAVEEGILRSHRITRDGRHRDSVIFSVLDREWPSVKNRIAERLRVQQRKRPPTPSL